LGLIEFAVLVTGIHPFDAERPGFILVTVLIAVSLGFLIRSRGLPDGPKQAASRGARRNDFSDKNIGCKSAICLSFLDYKPSACYQNPTWLLQKADPSSW
jgi:hypothetical protein